MTWQSAKKLCLMLSLLVGLIILGATALASLGWDLSEWQGWLYFLVGLTITAPFLIGFALSKLRASQSHSSGFKVRTIVIGCGLFFGFGLLLLTTGIYHLSPEAAAWLFGALAVASPFLIASARQLVLRDR